MKFSHWKQAEQPYWQGGSTRFKHIPGGLRRGHVHQPRPDLSLWPGVADRFGSCGLASDFHPDHIPGRSKVGLEGILPGHPPLSWHLSPSDKSFMSGEQPVSTRNRPVTGKSFLVEKMGISGG